MPQTQVSLSPPLLTEKLHCLLHIQQSPHCFAPPPKKMSTLHTKHTTLHYTTHLTWIWKGGVTCFFAFKHFLFADTFRKNSLFLLAPYTHQTWQKDHEDQYHQLESDVGCNRKLMEVTGGSRPGVAGREVGGQRQSGGQTQWAV